MTIEEFQTKSWEEMETYTTAHGVQIGVRKTYTNQYSLYQCNNFYVEYEYFEHDLLTNVKSFTEPELLEPYLNNIDIDEIKKPE